MNTTDAPASAAEQHTLALDSTVPPPAGPTAVPAKTPPVPAEPRAVDGETPADSPTSAAGFPARAADNTATPSENARRLAQLVAEGRRPRSQRFTALEPYRDVLLTERRAGASIRLIAQSLAKLDVAISEETLRVWFLKEKLPMRRRPRKKRAAAPSVKVSPVSPTMAARPVTWSVPTPTPGAAGTQPGRRGPKIARDNY
ncbi:MAG: hypothetical protein HZC55_27110 [Verrucomicrobia bacterium]|nr:hypothetical protein [Verrucomicrobiota bacterium]